MQAWGLIIQSIRSAGYEVSSDPLVLSPHLLPPNKGGTPQIRNRVFILAARAAAPNRAQSSRLPRVEPRPGPAWDPDDWRIRDYLLPDDKIEGVERYRLSPEVQGWVQAWEWFVVHVPTDDLPGFQIWVSAFRPERKPPADTPEWKRSFLEKNAAFYAAHRSTLSRWLRMKWGPAGHRVSDFPPSRQKFEWQARKRHVTRAGRTLADLVLQFRPSGIRVKPATYLPALVAISQTSIIGPSVRRGIRAFRRITPTEAARLQGIPGSVFSMAGVSDKHAYRQLGNAVNVGVVTYAAAKLLDRCTIGNAALGPVPGRDQARGVAGTEEGLSRAA